MRIFKTALAAVIMLGMSGSPVVAREKLTGEQELAKMLDGRVAGEARSCLSFSPSASSTIIDGTAIVYRQGGTLWVNVPANPEHLDSDDVLVSHQYGSSLCRQDHVETWDRMSMFMNGVVFLGEFVPYRKAS